MLTVKSQTATLGTIDLVDGVLVGDPLELLSIFDSGERSTMTAEDAYDSLRGWSNGWLWFVDDEKRVELPFAKPWHIVDGSSQCPASEPWAVVLNSTGEAVGCHATLAEAQAHMAALYANAE